MPTLTQLLDRATAGPTYPPDEADLRDVRIAGLDLPLRATIALFATTALILADLTGTLRNPNGIDLFSQLPVDRWGVSLQRFAVYGLAPLGIVVLGFGDRPSRYGLRLGDWRWGVGLLVAGLIVMTPIILGLGQVPEFRAYYRGDGGPLASVVGWTATELVPAEFLVRGFLLFALLRRIGPLAIVVVQVPFIIEHVGTPELELWSTFIGGSVFAWLDWRTGSIAWSALGHVYVQTLMRVAVGATA